MVYKSQYFSWLGKVLEPFLVSYYIGSNNQVTLVVKKQWVLVVMSFLSLHSNCQFKVLTDIAGVDFPGKNQRFSVVYQLLSIKYNIRLTVKTQVGETDSIQSVCGVYKAANWYEREAFDLFGIFFSGHPDLRRILSDYGFEGHPIRKDFPLSGFNEVRFSHEKKRVIIEPVEFSQEFRGFTYSNSNQLTRPSIYKKD